MPHVLMQQKHEFTSTCTTAESKNAMVSGAENPQTWSFWKCSSDTPWKTHCFLRLAWCSNVFQCWVVTHHIKIKSLNRSECVYCFDCFDVDAEKPRVKRKQWFQTSNEFIFFCWNEPTGFGQFQAQISEQKNVSWICGSFTARIPMFQHLPNWVRRKSNPQSQCMNQFQFKF